MNEQAETIVMMDGTKLSGVPGRFEVNLARLATLRAWPAVARVRELLEGAILADATELCSVIKELLYLRKLQVARYSSLRRRIERLEQMKTNVKETCETTRKR